MPFKDVAARSTQMSAKRPIVEKVLSALLWQHEPCNKACEQPEACSVSHREMIP